MLCVKIKYVSQWTTSTHLSYLAVASLCTHAALDLMKDGLDDISDRDQTPDSHNKEATSAGTQTATTEDPHQVFPDQDQMFLFLCW